MVSTKLTALLLLSMSEILSSACRLICLSSLSLLSHLLPSSHLPELLQPQLSQPSLPELLSASPFPAVAHLLPSSHSLSSLSQEILSVCLQAHPVSPLPAWPHLLHSPSPPSWSSFSLSAPLLWLLGWLYSDSLRSSNPFLLLGNGDISSPLRFPLVRASRLLLLYFRFHMQGEDHFRASHSAEAREVQRH